MPDDETGPITKDPRKKGFWSARNIGGLVMLALLSAGGPQAVESVQNYYGLHDRMEDHEGWRAQMEKDVNDQAYWDAFANLETKISDLNERFGAIEKLFDREFGRSAGEVSKEMEAELITLRNEREMIDSLHTQLVTMIAHYKEEHPESDTPELNPPPPPPAEEELRQALEQIEQRTQQTAPNAADPAMLKEYYHRRNPKGKK